MIFAGMCEQEKRQVKNSHQLCFMLNHNTCYRVLIVTDLLRLAFVYNSLRKSISPVLRYSSMCCLFVLAGTVCRLRILFDSSECSVVALGE